MLTKPGFTGMERVDDDFDDKAWHIVMVTVDGTHN
jgi:hypothetical protein